jgi:hypothetical protein
MMTVSGRPLLVTGQYGKGTTLAFTGFTPAYKEQKSSWLDTITLPYFLDQEFVNDPANRSYFSLFMRMVAAASGQDPAKPFDELLAAREKPLFESLKDQPAAALTVPANLEATAEGDKVHATLTITSGGNYARLVRVRAEWDQSEGSAPYLVEYGDNYFDLLPGESKAVAIEMFLPKEHMGKLSGALVVEGTNIESRRIPVQVTSE